VGQPRRVGRPRPSVVVGPDGDERLTPRGSFERWTETVRLHCRPWLAEVLASARHLHGALGTSLLGQAEALARSNSELVRANAELDAFAHSAAHDLREPLRGVTLLANFMVEDYQDVLDEVGRERMSRLVNQARRMARLLTHCGLRHSPTFAGQPPGDVRGCSCRRVERRPTPPT
jgi:chemotaxis family two-component system sensor kinase Cph1